jgi:cyclic pyranopterin phosphate synthase
MGAKRTADLVPMCHPLPLDQCRVAIEEEATAAEAGGEASGPDAPLRLRVVCTASTSSSTGVEMEALTGASVTALTLYDMLKAGGQGMEVSRVRLLAKRGGKADYTAAA